MAIAMTTGYSAQTEGARLCIDAASDWALTCVDQLTNDSSYVLMDYGAADGGTAVGLWSQVLDRLHKRQPKAHLTLIGNDLPSNDNVALAENIAKQLGRPPNPTVLVSARSFYEPLVAPETVSFGFSATAMHWLSESPGPLNTHTHVLASDDKEALERFTAQAMKDWASVLELRSAELAVGGRLLTVNLSRDEEGRYLGHNGGVTRNVHDQLHQIWRSLADEGVISEEIYRKGTILNFYKSRAARNASSCAAAWSWEARAHNLVRLARARRPSSPPPPRETPTVVAPAAPRRRGTMQSRPCGRQSWRRAAFLRYMSAAVREGVNWGRT